MTLGKPAPKFSLPSSDGGTVSLADLRGKYVVLYFYPKDNTPGCTLSAQDFRDRRDALHRLGAVIVGVSKDSIASHCRFRDKYQLSFPLLTDADGAVLEAYGAWGEKVMYGKRMMGVIRSTVLIDKDGIVARHWPKVSVKGHADEVVAAVEALRTPASKPTTTKLPPSKPSPAKPSSAKLAASKPPAAKPVATKATTAKKAAAKPTTTSPGKKPGAASRAAR